MKRSIFFSLALVPFMVLGQAKTGNMTIYKDPSKSVEGRVKDLLSRMTLQEKIAQMQDLSASEIMISDVIDPVKMEQKLKGKSFGVFEGMGLSVAQYAKAINTLQEYMVKKTRLGIPMLSSSEALHGCVHGGSTVYPQAIALGSTFNASLVNMMTNTITRELKAQGITQVLSPDLDLA
ncbi:MAG TPA: glycoside hydrolase family 3 N-terminal domain-containing protein, partial [Flavisolibacter sp.]|nr:glycoside hydrolase family 3 N-terminal domain-containing protein [Flavisolibacter sp.]